VSPISSHLVVHVLSVVLSIRGKVVFHVLLACCSLLVDHSVHQLQFITGVFLERLKGNDLLVHHQVELDSTGVHSHTSHLHSTRKNLTSHCSILVEKECW
jgi:bisphosphoglycerate-independent phosphoglycerate mutase (AlkP superfamily)